MGKQNPNAAKLLYKKSNCTLNTRSKTCSGASQFLTKSAILQMKKKLPKANYYIDNGKLKRDLSIATDKCILRGYYKKKLERFKYSMNGSEVGTIDKFKCDNSACGDSIPEENEEKARFNIDITSLVVENLKDLLNDWIKKYLLDNNETKQKIETVLDSILHKLELQRNSSSCTYTLDIEVGGQEQNASSDKDRQACAKHSCLTVPITGKHLNLISTLSIPRNMKKHVNDNEKPQTTKHTVHKSRYKSVYLTVSRSNTFLLNASSFNLLSISTKSFTKRCATYDAKDVKCIKKHRVVLVPKSSETIPDLTFQEQQELKTDYLETTTNPRILEIDPLPSLVKSIYADDPANVTSTEKDLYTAKNDHYTMTDPDRTIKNIASINQYRQLNWEKATILNEPNKTITKNLENIIVDGGIKRKLKKTNLNTASKLKKTVSKKKAYKSPKSRFSTRRHFTHLFKRSCHKDDKLMKDLRDLLKNFAQYTGKKNVKFDVTINVLPLTDNTNINKDVCKDETRSLSCNNVIYMNAEQIQNTSHSSSESQPKLISLLDGAVSQSKYVISKEVSSEKAETIHKTGINVTDPSKTLLSPEIANDLSELRLMIKDLAATIEKLVNNNLKKLISQKKIKKINSVNKIQSKGTLKTSTLSKAIQFSNNKSKNQLTSGFKLSKEPKKKDMVEFNARLAKKSVSYNVIESESILKVTDMTCAVPEISKEQLIENTPKSKSVLEMGPSKKKLLAYYYEDLAKSGQFIRHNKCRNSPTCSSSPRKYMTCPHIDREPCESGNHHKQEDKCCNELGCDGVPQKPPSNGEDCEICSHNYSCSSVFIDVEDRHNKIIVRSRSGMGFWEGLIYCILLWIPVIVILWLIYVYVIRDKIQPKNPAIGRLTLPAEYQRNNSYFRITLSDLGF